MAAKRRSLYFRPMARRADVLGRISVSEKNKFIQQTASKIKTAIKREAAKERWLKKPGAPFFKGVQVKIEKLSVTIILEGAAKYQNEGVEKHQMTYLRGLTIRFKPKGETSFIFRNVSDESLKRGGWTHPGYPGKGFVQRAIEKTKDIMVEQIADAVADEMADALGD